MSDADLEKADRMFGSGNSSGALRLLDDLIRDNPDSPEPHLHKAMILAEMEKFKSAMNCCKRAIKVDKDCGSAYGEMGLVLRRSGKPAKAISYYDRAIKIHERNENSVSLAIIYNNKGAALMDMRRMAESIRCYDKAIAINPNNIRAYVNKSTALAMMNRTEESEKCLAVAAKIDSKLTFQIVKQVHAKLKK